MKNVSGTLASGRLCAIMGPSGAGKSTFISLLTGKAKRTTGNVLINGKHDELSHYKKLIGFVPQEDVMLRELTVRQILMHSALMRLPTQMSYKQKKNTVLETISFLGLQGVMDSAIGDEEVRGISGGQRKRVNIGMELVAQPSVMFLDEPTSGLDSSTSKEVCELLKQLAHKQGLTVAAVIHSPSPAAYAQFDDLLLLGKGGGVVFFGPASEAPAYFAHLGFPLPPSTSPPDFYMDVLTGRTKRIAGPSEPSDGVFKPSYLFGCWDAKCKGNDPLLGLTAELLGPVRWGSLRGTGAANRLMRKKTRRQAREEETKQNLMSPTYGSVGTQVKPNAFKTAWYAVSDYFHDVWVYMVDVWEEAFSAITCGLIGRGDQSGRRTASPFVVFWLCLKRATYQNFRSPVLFIFDQIVHVMVGGFISIIADNKDYVGLQPTQVCLSAPPALQKAGCVEPADALRNVGQFICIGTLFAGISVGASTFGRERVVFWRDTAAGMPTFPYFIAKIVADIPRIIVASIACCCTLLILLPLRGSILYFALDVFLLYAAAFSMGYFLSSIMSYRSVTIWSTAFVLVWALVFNGVSPSIADIGKYPEPAQALWAISAPRWAIEAYYIREMEARDWYELKGNRTGVVGVTVQDYVKASGANSSASASMESGFEGMGIKNETIVGELRYGYHYAHKDLAFVYLSLVVVMWMGLAFFGMKLTNRNRQK
ncbi:P-loop containing nucleoside triphosphate hydrolase protein [Cladochytrium replicatum]|nr:P-loop containing nucleoside triphosphate hydrolase protein [Cladochytrium replicatum]